MRLTTLWQNLNRYLCMNFIVVLTSWAHRNMYVEHGQGYIGNVLYWEIGPLGAKLLHECHTCSHFVGCGYMSSSLSWAPTNVNKVKKSISNMPLIDWSIHPHGLHFPNSRLLMIISKSNKWMNIFMHHYFVWVSSQHPLYWNESILIPLWIHPPQTIFSFLFQHWAKWWHDEQLIVMYTYVGHWCRCS